MSSRVGGLLVAGVLVAACGAGSVSPASTASGRITPATAWAAASEGGLAVKG
jgi:hypothetical protein